MFSIALLLLFGKSHPLVVAMMMMMMMIMIHLRRREKATKNTVDTT